MNSDKNRAIEDHVIDMGKFIVNILKEQGYDFIHWNPAHEYPPFDEDILVFAVGKKGTCFEGAEVSAIMRMTDKNRFDGRLKTTPHWIEPWQYFNADYDIVAWTKIPKYEVMKNE